MDKKQISSQLKEAVKLLELKEEGFRARAFEGAARALENYQGDISTLMPPDIKAEKLSQLKGIGKGLVREIYQLRDTGILPTTASLLEEIPLSLLELFKVSGLGAKKIRLLWQANIISLEQFIQAAETGQLSKIKGFGAKGIQSLLESARFALISKERMLLPEAQTLAENFITKLKERLPQINVAIAGSLRRSLETIGDIDLVVTGVDMIALVKALDFVDISHQNDPLINLNYLGRPFQIILCDQAAFGPVLANFTGNADFRASFQQKAVSLGFILNDEGLSREGKNIDLAQEADFFAQLDMPYILPELRESADAAPIPNLISLKDIKGLVHNHSYWSDGAHSLREMTQAARDLGFDYLPWQIIRKALG
ncbi:MAG: helix-hairpin-helix domain-containing protein [Deinococcales bacterium]